MNQFYPQGNFTLQIQLIPIVTVFPTDYPQCYFQGYPQGYPPDNSFQQDRKVFPVEEPQPPPPPPSPPPPPPEKKTPSSCFRDIAYRQEPSYKRNFSYKRDLCKFYENGKCRFGDLCSFAHGEKELRKHMNEEFHSKRQKRSNSNDYY